MAIQSMSPNVEVATSTVITSSFASFGIGFICSELKDSLVIAELGSSRELDCLKPKIDTLQTITKEPNAIRGLVEKVIKCKIILYFM